jgi:hypothetical protein
MPSSHDYFEKPFPDSIDEFNRNEEKIERRQEAIGRWRRQQFELFELDQVYPECPNCGEHGEPVSWYFGRSAETGYHDAGEGCTACVGRQS